MKYINQINFVLLLAALAFSVYVFSQTFMKEGPADNYAGTAEPLPVLQGQSSSGAEAVGQGMEGNPAGARPSAPGVSRQAPNDSLRQSPGRNRRISPGGTRPSSAGRRPRPTFPSGSVVPDNEAQGPARMPSGAVNPDSLQGGDSRAAPSRRTIRPPRPPFPQGSSPDRPLPLSERGGAKREPDPNAPPPPRGSRQR